METFQWTFGSVHVNSSSKAHKETTLVYSDLVCANNRESFYLIQPSKYKAVWIFPIGNRGAGGIQWNSMSYCSAWWIQHSMSDFWNENIYCSQDGTLLLTGGADWKLHV